MLIKLETKSNRVKGMSFHAFRPWILASLHSGEIQLWDYTRAILLENFTGHEGPVRSVDFHNQQPLFVSGGDDYKVKVWNYKQKKCMFTLKGHNDYVRTTVFHVEYPWIASASDDQSVRIWNWQSRTSLCVLAGHNHYVMCACFHPTSDLLLSASLDQTLRVWDISGLRKKSVEEINLFMPGCGVLKYLMEGHTRGVNWACFHHNLCLIASGGDDHQVKLWRYEEDKVWEVCSYIGHYKNVSSVLFHKRQDVLISNGEDRTIKVWDLMCKTCVYTFRRERDRFWMLTAHPALNLFAAGHDTGMIIFKLEKERPVYCLLLNSIYYVKAKTIKKFDFNTSKDIPIIFITNISWNNPVRKISINPNENLILICVDAKDGSYYELRDLTKTEVNYRRHQAKIACWISTDTFIVIERSHRINIRNLKNEIITQLVESGDDIFDSLNQNTITLRNSDNVILFDTQKLIQVAKIAIKKCKLIIWSPNNSHVVLLNKYQILIYDHLLRKISTINERLQIKSGAWDNECVFIYTTTNHLKYTLVNGHNGVIRTLDVPVYITNIRNGKIYCLDRECRIKIFNIDSTEYNFKLALINRDYAKIVNIIRNNILVGQSIISYLVMNGYTNLALHFVKDKNTSFELGLKCGNLKVALNSAYALNKRQVWLTLAKSALNLGYLDIAELSYKRSKCSDKLFFLYLITGNFEKMRALAKRYGSSKECHAVLVLGNIQERTKLLLEAKKYELAYLTAVIHGLVVDAEQILKVYGAISGLNTKYGLKNERKLDGCNEEKPTINNFGIYNYGNQNINVNNITEISKSQETFSYVSYGSGEEKILTSPIMKDKSSEIKTQLTKHDYVQVSKSIEEIKTYIKVSQLRQQFEYIQQEEKSSILVFNDDKEGSVINNETGNSVKEVQDDKSFDVNKTVSNFEEETQNAAVLETSEESTSSFQVVLKSIGNNQAYSEYNLLDKSGIILGKNWVHTGFKGNNDNSLEYAESDVIEKTTEFLKDTSESIKEKDGQFFYETFKGKPLMMDTRLDKTSVELNELEQCSKKEVTNPKFLRAPPPIQKLSLNWPLLNISRRFFENSLETAVDCLLDAKPSVQDEEINREIVSDRNQTYCDGWDLEDQNLNTSLYETSNEDPIIPSKTINKQSFPIKSKSQMHLPTVGKSMELKIPGHCARLGNYKETVNLLNSQLGIVNFEPYRELLREICACKLIYSWQKNVKPTYVNINQFLFEETHTKSNTLLVDNRNLKEICIENNEFSGNQHSIETIYGLRSNEILKHQSTSRILPEKHVPWGYSSELMTCNNIYLDSECNVESDYLKFRLNDINNLQSMIHSEHILNLCKPEIKSESNIRNESSTINYQENRSTSLDYIEEDTISLKDIDSSSKNGEDYVKPEKQTYIPSDYFGSTYVLTIQELINKTQAAYELTTNGQFKLAIIEFQKLIPQITLLMVNKHEEIIAADLLKISSEYILGLKMEVHRRSLAKITREDQKNHCEFSAYFTHLNFLTIHKISTLRLALNICFKAKNFKSAQRFANRLLKLGPSDKIADQVNKMLFICQQNCVDALDFDYDESKPFILCGYTYKPIYNGFPVSKCCLCDSSYFPQFNGFVCNICTLSEIGFNGSGLNIRIDISEK